MKTKRVRIIGYIDPDGNHTLASLWGNFTEDEQLENMGGFMPCDSKESTWRRVVIEADVPLPEAMPIVVEGRVSE